MFLHDFNLWNVYIQRIFNIILLFLRIVSKRIWTTNVFIIKIKINVPQIYLQVHNSTNHINLFLIIFFAKQASLSLFCCCCKLLVSAMEDKKLRLEDPKAKACELISELSNSMDSMIEETWLIQVLNCSQSKRINHFSMISFLQVYCSLIWIPSLKNWSKEERSWNSIWPLRNPRLNQKCIVGIRICR